MKNTQNAVSLISGQPTEATRKLCDELTQQGVSVIIKAKADSPEPTNCEQVNQLAGQAGQDLFFNGWKLLF